MFSIQTYQQSNYKTYCLVNEQANTQVEIVPDRGGILTRWCVEGQDLLYWDADRFADPTQSIRGGIPILFPICGNLPNNSYTLDGVTYSLKQHGFARDLPWTVVDQVSGETGELTLRLSSNAETLAVYPFEFCLEFTYRVTNHRLEIRQRCSNLSDRVMPFSIGLHPYFAVTDKEQLAFSIPAKRYTDSIQGGWHAFTGEFDYQIPEIDLAFEPIDKPKASFYDAAQRRQIEIEYNNTFKTLVFWTIADKNYICLEPWSAGRNAINTGENLIHLHPQSTLETRVRITMIPHA